MKNLKNALALLLALAMLFAMTACGSNSNTPAPAPAENNPAPVPADNTPAAEPAPAESKAEIAPYNFNFSYGGNPGSSMIAVAELLMDDLSELSGGAFTFTTYNDPGYKESQALDELMNDLVDIVYLGSGAACTTITEVAYLGMPGCFRYTDDPETFLDYEAALAPVLSDIYSGYGIHYLGLRVPTKMAIVGTGEAVTTPAQLQGKIARASGTWLGKMMVSLDIGTATIGLSEIVTALQRHTIDACITGTEQAASNMMYEASDYISIYPETDGIGAMVMDQECWDKLDDAQKACVEEAIALWMDQCLELSESFYQESIDKFTEANVEFVEISDSDCDQWLATIDDIYAEIDAGAGEKGVQLKNAMLDFRASLG